MDRVRIILLVLALLILIQCNQKHFNKPSLDMITYRLETDHTGGPVYLLSFKNFNISHDVFRLNDSDIVRIKFAYPPQDNLMGTVYFMPRKAADRTTFDFIDTGLVGLDSVELRERFMKEITKNRIDFYFNDSIFQSISIEKEPIFEYLVGTEKELSKRKLN